MSIMNDHIMSLNDSIPKDKEHHLPLFQIREGIRQMEDIVLSDENTSLLNKLLQEHHQTETLQGYGLHPANRLLFCGYSGCGKTLTAEVLASELGLPLAIIRMDSVVSSLHGRTADNLRQIFNYITTIPMVVLFDGFDALVKEYAGIAEYGELKRTANAFLQMLDDYSGKSVLVATTNHEYILDAALWRRFDEVLLFEFPNLEQMRQLLRFKLRGLRHELNIEDTSTMSMFKGMSHADVARVLLRAAKEMVISGKTVLDEQHLQSAIRREDVRRAYMMAVEQPARYSAKAAQGDKLSSSTEPPSP